MIFLAVGVVVILTLVGWQWWQGRESAQYQASLQPFYTPPSPLPSTQPGYLIRTEPINVSVAGGQAYRMLYVSQLADGSPAVSSGMFFVPNTTAPAGGRKVVAWAHGTLGFGDNCAPSRNPTTGLNDTQNWLSGMMQRGWAVAATDYVGVGTPGEPYYLIGQSEAHDVLNSVRALRNFAPAQAGDDFATWGHSQGGHSSLFSAQLANSYAPELHLMAAAAAAPAAELPALFGEQYNNTIAWGIGPDAAVSWPMVYPNLPLQGILSNSAMRNYQKLAYGCVTQEVPGLELRAALGEKFFQTNPMDNPQWYGAAQAQTPQVGDIKVPLYIAQGLTDTVVLPNTTALLVQSACGQKVNTTTNWLGNTGHLQVAVVSGPSVVEWLQDRFDRLPVVGSCHQPLPVQPASSPAAPVN